MNTPFVLYFFLFPKGKKSLPNVVKHYKQAHTCQHSNICPYAFALGGQYPLHKGLCNKVGKEVTNSNINGKFKNWLNTLFTVLKSKVFVEKIAYYTSDYVSC